MKYTAMQLGGAAVAAWLALGVMASDRQDDSWKTLWWLPEEGDRPVAGRQIAISDPEPHLIFFPVADPAHATGWPLVVFLHGQGESAPKPLRNVAIQGPPQTAGRDPQSLDFAVLSPQKPQDARFHDADVGAWIIDLIDLRARRATRNRSPLSGPRARARADRDGSIERGRARADAPRSAATRRNPSPSSPSPSRAGTSTTARSASTRSVSFSPA